MSNEIKHEGSNPVWAWDGNWLTDAQGNNVLWYTTNDDGIHAKPEHKKLISDAPRLAQREVELMVENKTLNEKLDSYSVVGGAAGTVLNAQLQEISQLKSINLNLLAVLAPFIEIWAKGGTDYAERMAKYWGYDNLHAAKAAIDRAQVQS